MRRYILVVLVLTILILTPGCVNHSDPANKLSPGNNQTWKVSDDNTSVRILTDMSGLQVKIPRDPQRVAVFSGPITQIPYILGVQNRIVATTPAMKQSPLIGQIDPAIKNLSDIRGATGEVDYEILKIIGADLVICPPLDGQLIRKRTSIPVVVVTTTQGDSFEQIVNQIRFVGTVFNRTEEPERYEEFLGSMNRLVSERTRSIPDENRMRVFCGYDPTHLITYGNDTFLQERITLAGCRNAATLNQAEGSGAGKITPSQSEVTLEQVLAWNPDVIIIDSGSPDEIYRDARWAPVSAVKNHRVYRQPQGIFKWSRPNAESAVFYPVWLAKTVYPEKFSDIDLTELMKRYFTEFFQYHLTDDQVSAILNGSYGDPN
jgi:iron complex transport system substrate-binding protein